MYQFEVAVSISALEWITFYHPTQTIALGRKELYLWPTGGWHSVAVLRSIGTPCMRAAPIRDTMPISSHSTQLVPISSLPTQLPFQQGTPCPFLPFQHSLCHIESWAVDLAWDAIARFGIAYAAILPEGFYDDFVTVSQRSDQLDIYDYA